MTQSSFDELDNFYTSTPSTSTSTMSVIPYLGIGVSVLIFCLSICCTCYRIFIRRKSHNRTLFRPSGSMSQPLIPAVSSNMNYPIAYGNMGPGYRLGGNYPQQQPPYRQNRHIYPYGQPQPTLIPINQPHQQVNQQLIQPAERSPPLVNSTAAQTRVNIGRSEQPLQPLEQPLQPLQQHLQPLGQSLQPESLFIPQELFLQEDDPFDLPNDPPPEPDPTNPYSVEAITHLVALHRTRQIPAVRIKVTRDTIVEDLIRIYQKMDQWQAHSSVFCKFKGEEGLDAGGVMKDLYTTFWDKAKDIYFKGNVAYVPQINLRNYDLSVFVTLGRIFSHSTVLLRAVPLQICRTTLIAIIFGEMDMGQNTTETAELLEDFLQYIDLDDRLLIKKAMTLFDTLDESEIMKLQYIFETFQMENTPQKETLEANLSIIAYNELYVKPRVVCQKMGQGIPALHRDYFWGHLTFRHIDALYDVFRLTPNMVVDKLVCNRLLTIFSSERKSYQNLRKFIKDMPEDLLLKFLQFVTGERKVPSGVIMVHFTDQTGARRAPMSHTCMNILELPRSYTNYDDLKREFTNILQSDEAMRIVLE